MTFIKIPHDDIATLDNDEKRFLVHQWEKLNKTTYRVCAVYMGLNLLLSLYGLTIILGGVITFQGDIQMLVNIYPALLSVCLLFLTAMIKGGERRGFRLSLIAYLANTLSVIITPYYLYVVFLSVVPALFILRSLSNLAMVEELKKQKGYPYFTYTMSEKFSSQIYLKDEELHPADENYRPWNAFHDDENKKGETENDDSENKA